jgi:hypothetical protein
MILMLVLLVAGTGLLVVRRSWDKCRENSERLRRITLIDKIVDVNFRNIIPFEWRNEQKRKRQIFQGEPDSVVFATTHGVNSLANGALRFLRLRLDAGNLRVEYSDTPILYWDNRTAPRRSEIIAKDVDKLEFRYADFDSEKNLIWDSDWDEELRGNIPVALLMRVTWRDGSSIEWLRRTAGSSRDETYGRRIDERR